jgi:hypothetical protein
VPQGSAFPYSQAANGRDERVAPVSLVTPHGVSNNPGWRCLAVFGGKWRRMAPGLGARRGAPDRSPSSALVLERVAPRRGARFQRAARGVDPQPATERTDGQTPPGK